MNNTERKRIKPQLLKCAKENENRGTFTGYVIVSSVCRAAVERIEELEADIKLLEQRGSDILKELLDKNKKCIELERQIEKMKRHCNCKHRDGEGYCEVKRTYLIDLSYDGCDKWELED